MSDTAQSTPPQTVPTIDLQTLYERLELETRTPKLQQLPPNFYKDITRYIKSTRNGRNEDRDVLSQLRLRQRELLHRIASRLLEVRVRKALAASDNDVNLAYLTPEERYVVDTEQRGRKQLQKVTRAIGNGQVAVLESITDRVAHRRVVVRFLQAVPALVGTDLAQYGPFEREDVAVLPVENAYPLIKQGAAAEIWTEES